MTDLADSANDILITGIGLASSLGEGVDVHWNRLNETNVPCPVVDETTFAPYCVHPMVDLDLSRQIPRKGDQRQMEPWQRIGVYSAGLALDDAGIAGDQELLDRTDMIVAAGSGERDTAMDKLLLEKTAGAGGSNLSANEVLRTELRPTLFLAQLSNLLAGNISIVHKVTKSSRTFMGEEMAGMSSVQVACQRIAGGQGDLLLVGGAYNAEREDMLLILELGRSLQADGYRPIWDRRTTGGGMITGSAGIFLVLESRSHAEARGARAYARLSCISTGRCDRQPGASTKNGNDLFDGFCGGLAKGPLAILSGASGVEPALSEELEFLEDLKADGYETAVRAYGSVFGHTVEAQFPLGIALAAMAVSRGSFYGPFDRSSVETQFAGRPERIMVTGWGHWRGEGIALVETTT